MSINYNAMLYALLQAHFKFESLDFVQSFSLYSTRDMVLLYDGIYDHYVCRSDSEEDCGPEILKSVFEWWNSEGKELFRVEYNKAVRAADLQMYFEMSAICLHAFLYKLERSGAIFDVVYDSDNEQYLFSSLDNGEEVHYKVSERSGLFSVVD